MNILLRTSSTDHVATVDTNLDTFGSRFAFQTNGTVDEILRLFSGDDLGELDLAVFFTVFRFGKNGVKLYELKTQNDANMETCVSLGCTETCASRGYCQHESPNPNQSS